MPDLNTSLFDSFEVQGFWWLPSMPDDKIAGILRFGGDDIVLDLFGALVEKRKATAAERVADFGGLTASFRAEVVLGQAHDGITSVYVTLSSRFRTS